MDSSISHATWVEPPPDQTKLKYQWRRFIWDLLVLWALGHCSTARPLHSVSWMLLVWVKKWLNILVTWGRSGCFCWGCEDDESHWTVRCQAHLILSEYYSPDLSLWLMHVFGIHGFRPTWPWLIIEVRNFFNHLVTVLWSTAPWPLRTTNVFGYFRKFWHYTQFEFVKHKFHGSTSLHVHLNGFQITHGVKQCTTGQRTKNNYNTTKHTAFKLLRSRNINVAN